MQTLEGKRALVTGGASGIGRAIAHQLARRGADILLTDLDASLAERTANDLAATGARVRPYRLDVTDAAGIEALRKGVHADGGPVDLLVNNAGLVFGGAFLDVPLERHLATYRVNTLGLVAVTHAFLPDLIGRPDAHVVNVASASGYIGLPFGATYASSKWAVIGFSESLALELALLGHRHVHVTAVCPSYVATGMFAGVRAPLTTRLLTADRLADLVVHAILANRPFVRTPWLVKATPLLKGLLPFRVFYAMAARLGVSTSMTDWRGHGPA
ncbi:MAG: SDR family NAD(P)-dependent oxidoreductase [Candidatus Binatia bacterium]